MTDEHLLRRLLPATVRVTRPKTYNVFKSMMAVVSWREYSDWKKRLYKNMAATGALGERKEGRIRQWFETENGADQK